MAAGPSNELDETVDAGRATHAGVVVESVASSLTRGTSLGRYVALSELGSGGMGTVWAAYDPKLDRRVAIKVLHREAASLHDGQRLLREARALAKLSHPNVVAIHDVGTIDGRVWIAMEHVDGRTFGEWFREAPRPWQAVLDVVVPVGHGLAAAHAQGLVHRDIKPDNIMLGNDGRPRVMDFGLARSAGASSDSRETNPDGLDTADLTITPTGAVLGTPAYMAPEQHEGKGTDARTDVFSFCVTVWEAVHGERPFAGNTVADLYAAVLAGAIRSPPRERSSPPWLRRALAKGLAVRPEERWPSMEPLLLALAEGRTRRRRRRLAIAGLGALGLLGATLGTLELRRRAAIATCEQEGEQIAALWPGRADEVERALSASPLPYAAASLERLRPRLDAVASEWAEQRASWCRAVRVDDAADPELGRRAVACLDERRAALQALVDLWSEGDELAIRRAVDLVARHGRLDECADEQRLRRGTWPSDGWDEVAALRQRGAGVAAEQAAGRYVTALASAREIYGEAQALGFRPLVLEAELRIGDLLEETGDYAGAEATLHAVYFAAAAAGEDRTASLAATDLVYLVGHRLARFDEALRWAEHAQMELDRMGDADEVQQAALANAIGGVHEARGEYDQAHVLLVQAQQALERMLGPEHPSSISMVNNLAGMAARRGRLDEAEQGFTRVLELRERVLGPEHPAYSEALANLASVDMMRGDYDAALPRLEQALRVREAALGPEHPEIGDLLHNIGIVELRRGRIDRARGYMERVVALRERVLGPEHPSLGSSEEVLGHVIRGEGDPRGALPHYRRALRLREQAFGPDHAEVGNAAYNLANALVDVDELAEARVQAERALAVADRHVDTNPEGPAWPLQTLAFVLDEAGEHERAIASVQRAVAILEATHPPGDGELATARAQLQRMLDRRRERGGGVTAAPQP